MLANNENNNKKQKVILKGSLICFAFAFMGILSGMLIHIYYPNLLENICNLEICKKKCNEGFWGKSCTPCIECGRNGICNGSGTNNGNGLCLCNKGWYGKYCDQCDKNYFGNNCTHCDSCINGYCNDTMYGDGSCICYNYFNGKNCNKCIDDKFGKECNNTCLCINGKCNNGINGDGKCLSGSCLTGWSGYNCNKCDIHYETKNNVCVKIKNLSDICLHESKGLSIINDKYGLCESCPKNTEGKICSENGICDGIGTTNGDGSCICNNNYTGYLCDFSNFKNISLNSCVDRCSNNGICLITTTNETFCNCNEGYSGVNCNNCASNYFNNSRKCMRCENNHNLSGFWGDKCDKCLCKNGICNSGYYGDGSCNCQIGWKGLYCDKCKNNYYGMLCDKCNNCNHGICNDTINGNGKCVCNKGYTGLLCNKCSNGFTKINNYCAECPGSYGGTKKECSGNGKCITKNNLPYCECDIGWTGFSCSTKVNVKSNCSKYNNCNKRGVCQDSTCFCYKGHTGDNCNITLIMQCNTTLDCGTCLYCDNNNRCSLKNECSNNFMVISNNKIKETTNIEKIEKTKKINETNPGNAMSLSVGIVFIFIGLIASILFVVKNKNKIKRYATKQTASKNVKIELTKEEKEFILNPILTAGEKDNKLKEAILMINDAIRKDEDHYYSEAIKLYEKSLDVFLHILKYETNSQTRFELAKKLDKYIQRVNYLKRIEENKKIIN